jgi:hypothetical protein
LTSICFYSYQLFIFVLKILILLELQMCARYITRQHTTNKSPIHKTKHVEYVFLMCDLQKCQCLEQETIMNLRQTACPRSFSNKNFTHKVETNKYLHLKKKCIKKWFSKTLHYSSIRIFLEIKFDQQKFQVPELLQSSTFSCRVQVYLLNNF